MPRVSIHQANQAHNVARWVMFGFSFSAILFSGLGCTDPTAGLSLGFANASGTSAAITQSSSTGVQEFAALTSSGSAGTAQSALLSSSDTPLDGSNTGNLNTTSTANTVTTDSLLASTISDSGTIETSSNTLAIDDTNALTLAMSKKSPNTQVALPSRFGQANPILFVTQVPSKLMFASRMATFANHIPEINRVSRGGDLMIRYPDGTLRNLTKEANFGVDGLQNDRSIAVREPRVHWSGTKAIFSMVIGAPTKQYEVRKDVWQMYEVSGLGKGEPVSITKVANQPTNYNNVSPFYGTDGKILFTSDRPRGGEAHLYPQLDEYESSPTTTGVWSLDPVTARLRILNHAPSGAFTPFIDSFGRILFTRWDHLQRDQQADLDIERGTNDYGAFNFSDETANALRINSIEEQFPEPRKESNSIFGRVNGFETNLFAIWQMNQDGTDEETINHFGRHEFQGAAIAPSFRDDPALKDPSVSAQSLNRFLVPGAAGFFQLAENPRIPGQFYAIYAKEFQSLSSGFIVRFNASPSVNPDSIVIERLNPANAFLDPVAGRFRTPLLMTDGNFIASYTTRSAAITDPMTIRFSLVNVINGTSPNELTNGAPLIPNGIVKSVSWWNPDQLESYNGPLWELDAVEVVDRVTPKFTSSVVPTVEQAIFTQEGVDELQFRTWMAQNNLSLIVTRNQTSREVSDKLQPFNLQVPNGVSSISEPAARKYNISHLQIFQADQIRGYKTPGRRPLAIVSSVVSAKNPANATAPKGSVPIASDGSTAAFVPANRALTWQTTDNSGNAVVRERVWVTFQPGEVRVCASCHGVNRKDQLGRPEPQNPPEALRVLLRQWKLRKP